MRQHNATCKHACNGCCINIFLIVRIRTHKIHESMLLLLLLLLHPIFHQPLSYFLYVYIIYATTTTTTMHNWMLDSEHTSTIREWSMWAIAGARYGGEQKGGNKSESLKATFYTYTIAFGQTHTRLVELNDFLTLSASPRAMDTHSLTRTHRHWYICMHMHCTYFVIYFR